jgi:hypothetical protein
MVVSRIAPILGMLPEPVTPEITRAIAMPMNGRGIPGMAPPAATPARPAAPRSATRPAAPAQREAGLAPR